MKKWIQNLSIRTILSKFLWFPSIFQDRRQAGNLGFSLFLLLPFLFITHTPSYVSTLYEYCIMTGVWEVLCIIGENWSIGKKNPHLVLTISEI